MLYVQKVGEDLQGILFSPLNVRDCYHSQEMNFEFIFQFPLSFGKCNNFITASGHWQIVVVDSCVFISLGERGANLKQTQTLKKK